MTKAQWRAWAKRDVLEWQILMNDLIKSFDGSPPEDLLITWQEIDEMYQKRFKELSMTQQEIDLQKITEASKLIEERFDSLSEADKLIWMNRYEELCESYYNKYGEREFQTRERWEKKFTVPSVESDPVSNEDSPEQLSLV